MLVNILNTWGLVLIGLGLILGLFTRLSQVAGIALLFMYYLSHPPVLTEPGFFREGSYFFISKDFVEMLTLHTHDYWSAKHPTWHDNMYCFDPDETIAFMETLEKPWIAFKTLAAGSIKPEQAFPYAFKSGADFLCVGMYDFQIIDDVNLACDYPHILIVGNIV